MNWFRSSATRNSQRQGSLGAEGLTTFAERKETLYWTALMITGDAQSAEHSVVDTGFLAETDNYEFLDWMVRWGRSATARLAVNAVRSSVHAAAAQYDDRRCSHRKHEPLSPAEIRSLRELDALEIIQRLDVLARAVLVLYGCHRASLSECALFLDVPLPCVAAACCRALQWCHESTQANEKIRRPDSPRFRLVRYDSDGVPVWYSQVSSVNAPTSQSLQCP